MNYAPKQRLLYLLQNKTKAILNEHDLKKSGLGALIKGMNEENTAKRPQQDMMGVIGELEEIRDYFIEKRIKKESNQRIDLNFKINKLRFAIHKKKISEVRILLPVLELELSTLKKGDPAKKAMSKLRRRANKLLSRPKSKSRKKVRKKQRKYEYSAYRWNDPDINIEIQEIMKRKGPHYVRQKSFDFIIKRS